MMGCMAKDELADAVRNVGVPEEAWNDLRNVARWAKKPQKEVVAEVISWLGWLKTVDKDAAGAIVGHLPMARRPAFAKLILQYMAEASVESDESSLKRQAEADAQADADAAERNRRKQSRNRRAAG